MIRVALDSNVLAYLAGVSRSSEDEAKITEVRSLIEQLANHVSLIAPAQALGELFVVLRRSGAPADDARSILIEFTHAFGTSASKNRARFSPPLIWWSIISCSFGIVDPDSRGKRRLHPALVGRYAERLHHARRDDC